MSLVLAVVVLAVCGSLFAHHGNAAYDNSKIVAVKDGVVTQFVWANPHSLLMFDAKDANGKVIHWVAEAGSPSALGVYGWNRNSLQPGDMVTVYLYQSKLGRPVGRFQKVVLANGTELPASGARPNTEK
jgi:hypothetical protein